LSDVDDFLTRFFFDFVFGFVVVKCLNVDVAVRIWILIIVSLSAQCTTTASVTDLLVSLNLIAGCSASAAGCSNRTLEAPPTGQLQPSLEAVNATAVLVSWAPPSAPNGVVTRYADTPIVFSFCFLPCFEKKTDFVED
jgi:hypothetical protein